MVAGRRRRCRRVEDAKGEFARGFRRGVILVVLTHVLAVAELVGPPALDAVEAGTVEGGQRLLQSLLLRASALRGVARSVARGVARGVGVRGGDLG